jgi:hypothetical protein
VIQQSCDLETNAKILDPGEERLGPIHLEKIGEIYERRKRQATGNKRQAATFCQMFYSWNPG